MKKIVIINQSTGYLTIDVINQFAEKFDQVDLIYGTMTEENNLLNPKVRKTRVMKKTRKSNVGRFFRWGFASIQIQLLLWTKYRKHEVFYYTLPPFAYLGALLLRRKYSIMVFDVYPDVLKSIGLKERNFIYRFWAWANRRIFKKAHKIYTIHDGLKNLLLKYGDKIHVVDLWTSLTDVEPVEKSDNPFSVEHGLVDKFVVQYSGNIGQTHNVELLIELADHLKSQKHIHFVIIGRGTKVPMLEREIRNKGLSNIIILPFQPHEMLKYSLSNADLGVVMLDQGSADVSLPSKTFNMMAAGSCILALASKGSALDIVVSKHNAGFCIPENDFDTICNTILNLSQSKEKLNYYKKNALNASVNYTERNAKQVTEIYFTK